MPAPRRDLPSTLKRSARRAQDTYAKAFDSAVATYGAGDRARRSALAAVRGSFKQTGNHWEPKATTRGSSNSQATRRSNSRPGRAVNVDADANKDQLLNMARRMHISAR